jgi:hypothetical protein
MMQSVGLGHAETNQLSIPTATKKVGEGLYIITFEKAIPIGEFAITIEKTKQGYDFGIEGELKGSDYYYELVKHYATEWEKWNKHQHAGAPPIMEKKKKVERMAASEYGITLDEIKNYLNNPQ